MSNTYIQGSSHTATANLTDAGGVFRPLPAGIVPVWAVDNAVITLSPAADGMTCPFTCGSTDGDFNLTCTVTYADGDVITGNFAGSVVDPEDTQVTITVV